MPRTVVTTDRVVVRTMRETDLATFRGYRSDPAVAALQAWPLPYPDAAAAALVAEMSALDGPIDGSWVQLAIADRDSDELLGDVAVHLFDDGRQAEIGCTLATAHQGRGIAAEAVGALLDHLFDVLGVHRVSASVDPDNVASARLLERLGFRFEGAAHLAVWHRDRWVDDERFAMLAPDRAAWVARPISEPGSVELVEVTEANLRTVISLQVHRTQERLVASNLLSLAQVAVPDHDQGEPIVPWPRAVCADGDVVGFVMLAAPSASSPDWYLWRLMIDRVHQQRGIGRRVLDLVARHVRGQGGTGLKVSWVPGPGSPEPFYLAAGFVPTGEIDEGEVVARLGW